MVSPSAQGHFPTGHQGHTQLPAAFRGPLLLVPRGSLLPSALTPPLVPTGPVTCPGSQGKAPEFAHSTGSLGRQGDRGIDVRVFIILLQTVSAVTGCCYVLSLQKSLNLKAYFWHRILSHFDHNSPIFYGSCYCAVLCNALNTIFDSLLMFLVFFPSFHFY